MSERRGVEHYGEERAETAEAQAEQIIAAELKRRRWEEADLTTRPKGDAAKVALAARLRAERTMTGAWIAERLRMGTRGHLNHLLYRKRKSGGEQPLSRTDPCAVEDDTRASALDGVASLRGQVPGNVNPGLIAFPSMRQALRLYNAVSVCNPPRAG
jgi:hypothetical protein